MACHAPYYHRTTTVQALEYIHTKSICHRDLKPDNLLTEPARLRLKLIDFGCAKVQYVVHHMVHHMVHYMVHHMVRGMVHSMVHFG